MTSATTLYGSVSTIPSVCTTLETEREKTSVMEIDKIPSPIFFSVTSLADPSFSFVGLIDPYSLTYIIVVSVQSPVELPLFSTPSLVPLLLYPSLPHRLNLRAPYFSGSIYRCQDRSGF